MRVNGRHKVRGIYEAYRAEKAKRQALERTVLEMAATICELRERLTSLKTTPNRRRVARTLPNDTF